MTEPTPQQPTANTSDAPRKSSGRPLLNSALADALRAATQGSDLQPDATAEPQAAPASTPVIRADRRPARQPRPPRRDGGTARREGDRRLRHQTAPAQAKAAPRPRHPVVEKLAGLYPALFGEQPLPLKRGIFQDLLAAHPDAFDKAELKVALGLHTRSTRYLNAVAMGQPRHDLQGNVVEQMAPEHVFHALVEAFRRRKPRDGEDLQAKLRRRMGICYAASGLTREAFLERVHVNDEATRALLTAALQEVAESDAKAEALASAFAASGKTAAEFADMYGMHPAAVDRQLKRAGQLRQMAAAPAPAAPAAAAAAE